MVSAYSGPGTGARMVRGAVSSLNQVAPPFGDTMFWAVLVARVVLGLPFLVFGLNYFLHFMPMPPSPPADSPAGQFGSLLYASGYMNAVKVFEITGGALVLSGRLVPLGLMLLTPVAVNILFYEIFLVGKAGLGVALVVLCLLLIWSYRSHFAAAVRRAAADRVIWSRMPLPLAFAILATSPVPAAVPLSARAPGCAPRTTAPARVRHRRREAAARHLPARRRGPQEGRCVLPVDPRRRTRHRPDRTTSRNRARFCDERACSSPARC